MWFADRTLRFSRWLFYGYGNYCKLTPLPEGATRVTLHRSVKAQPGSHAFLWIPGVRLFQTHPFTLVSNNPAEFIVSAHDGFTKELHALALKDPKAMRRAAIEGPYGNVPSTANFDKVLLIGGGSGATFTLAMAMDWLRKNKHGEGNQMLDFVWAVKSKGKPLATIAL
jgi:NAD(P)H-flavin reductase